MSPRRPLASGRSTFAFALALGLAGLACGGGGASTPASIPSAPTGLVASDVHTTSFRLCWTAAAGATGYTVLSQGTPVATTSETCAAVGGLEASTDYVYTVTANAGGESSEPSEALAVRTAPRPPAGVAATAVGGTTAELCWRPAVGAREYTVWAGGEAVATTTDTCAVAEGLATGTSYTFTVTTKGSKGYDSDPSAAVDVTTGPPAPTALASSDLTDTSVRLCWTASDQAAGYTVLKDVGLPAATTTETCATVGGLGPHLTYDLRVTAQDAEGRSSDAAVLPVTTLAGDAVCPVSALPAFDALVSNRRLPDPFRMEDGGRITRLGQWRCRSAQISSLVQGFELGEEAPPPDGLGGTFAAETGTVTVTAIVGDQTISFDATVTYPPEGAGAPPYPAVIAVGFSALDNAALANLGVAVITFPSDDLAEEVNGSSRGQGKFYTLFGSGHPAGALMAWSWGISRLIDTLETLPAANIDTTHLGVTGCSRSGKGALVAGAFEPRIKLTIPQESGTGGAGSWRVAEFMNPAHGSTVQTLWQIVQENVWFRQSFSQFSYAVNELPFDHHELAGLIAPRGLLVIENTDMQWLGNFSTFVNANAMRMIWEGLGAPTAMGYSQVGHSVHCQFPAAQQPAVTAFVQRFLLDQDVEIDVLETDASYSFDADRWAGWTVPALE